MRGRRRSTLAIILGNTGLKTQRVSLGTVKLGRNTDVKYPSDFQLPDDHSVRALLECCRELGVNLIDTAPAYGTSEERIGLLLPGQRDEWILCSKVGEKYEDGVSTYNYSADAVNKSVAESLKKLATDYLDILLIHSDGNDMDIIQQTDIVDTLTNLKKQGLVRYIGMSPKTVEGTKAALSFSDVIMVTLNIEDQSHLGVIGEAEAMGCGILLKKVLASGHRSAEESLSFVRDSVTSGTAVVGTIRPEHLRANFALLN